MMTFRPSSPHRRLLIQGLCLTPLVGCDAGARSDTGAALFAAFQRFDGSRGVARLDASLKITATCALPARAHDILPTPSGRHLIVMERRPGRRGWVIDSGTCRRVAQFEATAGRHFEGHALFTPQGLLLTTENDYENGRGVIGVRDPGNWQVLGEFPSHGIGPHEMLLMPDGKGVAIANGGILTHPEQGGRKLNLETMRSSLSYVEISGGKLLGEWLAPERHLSIRHMDIAQDGEIVIGMQYEGTPGSPVPPLLARHKGQEQLVLPVTGPQTWNALRGYIGSIRLAPSEGFACASSPRGGIFLNWNLASNRLQNPTAMPDVCGLAFRPDGELLLSSGTGQVRTMRAAGSRSGDAHKTAKLHWDNHMRYVATMDKSAMSNFLTRKSG